MNYSKESRVKSEKQNNDTNKKIRKKSKIVIFRLVFMACIISLFAVVGGGLGIFIGIIKSTPDVSQLDLKPTTNYTSFVFDANGKQIDSFSGAENRIYVTLDNIPAYLQQAFVALEDERFYEHNGIDIRGIFRAIFTNLKSGGLSEGASTITQQLIKNNILTSEKKFTRKIQEQYLAIEFEKLYSKDLILEYYLNTIALGHGVNGVQAASNRYFNKDVNDLTLAESVVIAVITQAPTRFSPILNPENNKEKVQIALTKMADQGYITEAQMQQALKDDPYLNIQKVHQEFVEKSSRSYFVDAVMQEVINDLQSQKGMTSTKANNLIYGGGLQIYTTLDPHIQEVVDKYVDDESLYPKEAYELKLSYSVNVKKADGNVVKLGGDGIVKSEADIESFKQAKLADWGITARDKIEKETLLKMPQPQTAFVVTDYRTGQVKALAGGRGDKQDRGFNHATQAKRQPGSTFKILAAYAPAIDTGKLSPGSVLIDEQLTLKLDTGATWSPKNWNGKFEGPTSVRRAIYNSMNVLAVKTLQLVGLDTAYDYLLNFGFTTLSPTDKVYSLPLGGLTQGVTSLELNAAYGAVANDGIYIKSILYTKVLDKDGNILLDNSAEATLLKSHPVIKESTAHMLTDMMQEVITAGTGGKLRSTFKSMPIAGKTGTTSDDKDLLFSGYTPYYAATIWTGHDTPKKLRYGSTGSYHLDIWGKIMNEIHEGLPYKAFPKVSTSNSGVSEIQICTLSGKLATDLCRADPDHVVKTEFFNSQTAPKEVCDIHVQVDICTISNKIASEFCPIESILKKTVTRDSSGNISGIASGVCDLHGPQETPGDDWPWPTIPPNNPSDPNTPPTDPTPPPNTEPTPPPVVDPSPTPGPDDQDNFFIPQN
ncbi:transglycosylase domain-containing protein [Cellulosilyticum sp. I15G10I2]|uniref:transglycosylase domain-containing protein n=1 Tax=Cellulosilyticum sp. I15G10I2 TaxID=1892843 RepID=UPI00085C7D8A|nr:PBP1A family penicillin-binding protein [Cellulosilyticum sp. I15G10I2]